MQLPPRGGRPSCRIRVSANKTISTLHNHHYRRLIRTSGNRCENSFHPTYGCQFEPRWCVRWPPAAGRIEDRATDNLQRRRNRALSRPDRLVLRTRRHVAARGHRVQPACRVLRLPPPHHDRLTRNEVSWRISDHYPLWAEFRIPRT